MIKLLKALVILALLGAMLVGGGAGAYYFLVQQPKLRGRRKEAHTSGPAGQPTPDPSTEDFEKAPLPAAQPTVRRGARDRRIETFLIHWPDSTHREEAETMLGELNVSADLMSGTRRARTRSSTSCSAAMSSTASRTRPSATRNCFSRPTGWIAPCCASVRSCASRRWISSRGGAPQAASKVVLLNHGRFFRSYAHRELAGRSARKFPDIHTKVQEKMATKERPPGGVRREGIIPAACAPSRSPASPDIHDLCGEDETPDKPAEQHRRRAEPVGRRGTAHARERRHAGDNQRGLRLRRVASRAGRRTRHSLGDSQLHFPRPGFLLVSAPAMNVTPLDFEQPILELEKKLDDFKRHLHGQEIDSDPEVRRIAATSCQRPNNRFTPI